MAMTRLLGSSVYRTRREQPLKNQNRKMESEWCVCNWILGILEQVLRTKYGWDGAFIHVSTYT